MKLFNHFLIIAAFFFSFISSYAQTILPTYSQNDFPTYYWQKVSHFETLPKTKAQTIFIGDSITDGAEWSAIFNDSSIINFGISGDLSAGIINRLPAIAEHQPKKLFIMIGVNDLARNVKVDSLFKNICLIVKYINEKSSSTKVFVQSLLPVNNEFKMFTAHTDKTDFIIKLNALLGHVRKDLNYTFINLYPSFCDDQGKLKSDYTNDGLHLKGTGYALWKHLIYPYVYSVQESPAIIPKPKEIAYGKGLFSLYKAKYILYSSDSLKSEALSLQKSLAESGIRTDVVNHGQNINGPFIKLEVDTVSAQHGAYTLNADTERITITAASKAGIYYGIQTLKQLGRDGYFINTVNIRDEPAFRWRAYMVDVGRNYQSISLLKQQIDVMAAYKLNVFHMHLTEDIAWRLAIKSYPQLTRPEFMERNKGMYYTEAELKELIRYCRGRHILFVPEIDMPGHSAAFKKAMQTDMQSDSGLVIIKNILKEFCETYDVPYIHIGADEVKITNKNFLPEISALLKSLNKKVIGWEPGGNFDQSTIRQLWMDDAGLTSGHTKIQYIDSRHLYLNHMDPLESVITIFNRQLADTDVGNTQALGATLCLWPDRAVSTENDVLRMNGVYPAMLAFTERSWLGNGHKGWVANMDLNGSDALESFKDFEKRLMDHKTQYFNGMIFPYQEQSNLSWKLYGPYYNKGNLLMKFEPESPKFDMEKIKERKNAIGGTIIFRHWWAPKIKGVLDDPQENTTWYAFRKIWSDQDTVKNFWIGFNNLSRSQATDTPKEGQWDNHHSAVWVNETLVQPPMWLHAGQKGNLEIPLADEGYEFRQPAILKLKKGWNTIKIKAPIGSFKGENWNNPEKWMFTFAEVN